MDRVLRDVSAVIRIAVTDNAASPWDSDNEELDVVVTDSAGVEVDTFTAAKEGDVGVYSFTVPASQTSILDIYDVEWTGEFDGEGQTYHSQYEVVGGFFFTISEARAFDNGAMGDVNAYPTQTLIDGREQVEEEIEDACGVAFVPRGTRVSLNGSGTEDLILPHTRVGALVSMTEDDDALDVADVTLYGDEGRLFLSSGTFATGFLNVSVLYERGYTTPPTRIKRAALMLLRDRLVGSNIPDRALSHTDDGGTVTLAAAGTNGPFGIPEVDAAVEQYRETVPQIG